MLVLSPQLGAFMVGLSSEWLAVLIDVLWSIDRLVGEFQVIRVSVLSPISGLCLAFFSAIKLLPSQVKLTRFALLLLAPLALGIRQAAIDPLLRVDIFDVGQGLAVLVRTRKHTLICDTGPSYGEDYDAGLAVVLPAMAALGVESLDKIVISHFDDDHSGGGLVLSWRHSRKRSSTPAAGAENYTLPVSRVRPGCGIRSSLATSPVSRD